MTSSTENKDYQGPLIRIVRLTLHPDEVPAFLQMFEDVKGKIRASAGCMHLELLVDASYPNIMTTYSVWENEEALNAYRNSDLFRQTWKKTKRMFAAPPLAYSSFKIDGL